MNYNERIQKLVDTGRITPDIGRAMAASLSGITPAGAPAPRKRLPAAFILTGALLATGAILAFGGGSGAPETIQNVNEILNKTGEVGQMNKGFTGTLSIILILMPVLLAFVYFYNDLVSREEQVMGAWAQVESNYQRRADLVPNLVNTVKTYMEHEKSVLGTVTESRPDNAADVARTLQDLQQAQEKAAALSKDAHAKIENEQYMRDLSAAQKTVGDGIGRLFGLVENYPQLRSADNFLALQDQLEGTENRINVARMLFNDTVRDYNAAIRMMPGSLMAGMGGFQRKAYFEADKASETPVSVGFE